MTRFLNTLWGALQTGFTTLFLSDPPRSRRVFIAAWLLGVYLLGAAALGVFLNWGDHTLFMEDWAQITGPRFAFLRNAVKTNQLPLHISDSSTMHGNTLRYLAVPDTFISPQYLLLGRFSIQRFNYINVLLMYTLGFAGLLALAHKLRLSLFSFTLLSLLYNLNGNILAHYAVGHVTWYGYFLFSWFAYLLIRLVEGDHSWAWTFWMSLLLFFIWLQGSFHQYLWLLIMLGLVGLTVPGKFWVILRSGFFVLVMSAFRLLPAILLVGKYGASYIDGYPSLWSLLDSLVNISAPGYNSPYFPHGIEGMTVWETASFIGLLGTLFLIYFGLVRGLLDRDAPGRKLMLPILGMILLSMGQVFGYLRLLPIPLLQGERIGTRIISVGLAFLLILAAERFQRWLDRNIDRSQVLFALTAGGAMMGIELWTNLTVWKIPTVVEVFWWTYYDVDKWTVKNNFGDTTYLWLVFGGLAISIFTILGLGLVTWLEKRRSKRVAL